MSDTVQRLKACWPWILVVGALGFVFGPALATHITRGFDPHIFNDDARQQIYPFFRYADSSLFPNDYIADYYLDCLPLGFRGLYALCPYIAGTWPQDRLPSSTENDGIMLHLHNNRGAMAYGIETLEILRGRSGARASAIQPSYNQTSPGRFQRKSRMRFQSSFEPDAACFRKPAPIATIPSASANRIGSIGPPVGTGTDSHSSGSGTHASPFAGSN